MSSVNQRWVGNMPVSASMPDAPNEIAADVARQAVHALRGYAYQIYASAIAWLELRGDENLYVEVAEDFAVVTDAALKAVQVKDTPASGSVTLGSGQVTTFLDAYVSLVQANPNRQISLCFLSTAPIGREKTDNLRVGDEPALRFWRKAAAGADVSSLRHALASANLSSGSLEYFASLDDASFRSMLRHIKWHCGQPPLEAVKAEFEQLLIPFGWDHGRIPPSEAARLVSPIVERILLTCANAGQRKLSRADLLDLVDAKTRLSVSRSDADRLMEGPAPAGSFVKTQRLIPQSELGVPSILAERPELNRQLTEMLLSNGTAFVTGGSGMGKTLAVRLAARDIGTEWSILDLRNLDAGAAATRLMDTLPELSLPHVGGVIIDDINQLDDPATARSFAVFLQAMRRRDQLCYATVYRRPSVRALTELGISSDIFIEIPSLSQRDVESMIKQADGDPSRWGAAIYRRSNEGHPQLVQASIVGLQSRGWPAAELEALLQIGGSSGDIQYEKASTRARLIGSIPEASRALLYRLSLAIGKFDRRTALKLGQLDPKIESPGEALDQLIGPWIDEAGNEMYRVSPLLSDAGNEVLADTEVAAIHSAFADAIMSPTEISVDQASAAYVHGLVGKAEFALTKFAHGIIASDSDTRRLVSKSLISLRITTTTKPIFPSNKSVSGMLRLAQLLVCLEAGRDDEIAAVWDALWREKADLSLQEGDNKFEALIIAKLLISDRASRAIPSWFDLLLRLDELGRSDDQVAAAIREMETPGRLKSAPTVLGMLFMSQAMRLGGIEALARLFERLDNLEPDLRRRILAEYENAPGEFGLLINSGWLAENEAGTIEPIAAARWFRRISELGRSWGYPSLAATAEIAVAIMQDEYGHDTAAAIQTLNEGAASLGCDDQFTRALAKVLYRQSDYEGALEKIRTLDPDYAKREPIERTFLCREAGVCAGHIEEWSEARFWFEEGRSAAFQVPANQMLPAAIGLGADAAYASYMTGDRETAFRDVTVSLGELERLDPASSLRATHCYKTIGHLVLWMNNQVSHDFEAFAEGMESLPPGCCSNPDPHEDIKGLPRAPLDTLWYLLADAEIRSHVSVGAAEALQVRIGSNQILGMELRLREGRVSASIETHDDLAFFENLRAWLDLRVHLKDRLAELKSSDMLNPIRDTIPRATQEQLSWTGAREAAEEAIFSYLFSRILAGSQGPIHAFYDLWSKEMTLNYPGTTLVQLICGTSSEDEADRLPQGRALNRIATGERFNARDLFTATLRFTEAGARSVSFGRPVEAHLDGWASVEWAQLISTQRFSLVTPAISVPALERALAREPRGYARVAAILLAAEAAVGVRLSPEFRDFLRQLSAGPVAP